MVATHSRRLPELDETAHTQVTRRSAAPVDGAAVRPPVRNGEPATRLDAGGRIRWIGGLQASHGNGVVQRVLAPVMRAGPSRATVQRDGDTPTPGAARETPGGGAGVALAANPYLGEHDAVTLSNARFAGIRALERIATGDGALSRSDNGAAVKAVQQALLDLGYSLLLHHQDGSFGGETTEAIRQFRTDRGIPGDEMTALALHTLDQDAPPPGQRQEHYLDYERLFADDRLDITIAMGYDEGQSHVEDLKTTRAWLAEKGLSPSFLPDSGEPTRYDARTEVTYPTTHGTRVTKTITVRVRIIEPGAGAAAEFGTALNDSEITIYTGHARRGIGPDFDEDKSAAENFVIGVNSALHAAGRAIAPSAVDQHHYVIDKVNDLEAMTQAGRFDAEKYRVWFFNACTSLAYFDEIRGGILPAGMDRSNLDLFGSNRSVPIVTGQTAAFALIDGVLRAETMEEIVTHMEDAGVAKIEGLNESRAAKDRTIKAVRGAYVSEGAGDNPTRESP